MTSKALEEYQQARDDQLLRNEARHIRAKVNEARQASHAAGMRWPFELLQNALDVGPRQGREAVAVFVRQEEGRVIFEHDGAPFTSQELSALLSGGSSKEFGSEQTTGRFGTGFLVTHVLAERTSVEGLLSVSSGYELFRLMLDRGGDEDEILENINRCNEAIRQAQPVAASDSLPSARFEYPIDNDNTLRLGIEAFRSALPYLYGTRPGLGDVRLAIDGVATETWTPAVTTRNAWPVGHVEDRLILVQTEDGSREYQILRVTISETPLAAALVLLENQDGAWQVRPPGATAPRIYRHYPLRDSGFLPIGFVFDGQFEVNQERSRTSMNDRDKAVLSEAFSAAVIAADYASRGGWRNSHLLPRAAPALSGFDSTDGAERSWWQGELASFAERLARLPIVETAEGPLAGLTDNGTHADFIAPRLLDDAGSQETSVERMWPLLNQTNELYPPIRELAADWSATADGWAELGLKVNRVTVQLLANYARGNAVAVDGLRVSGNPHEWLAQFIDVVGECWERRLGVETSVLKGILPNQNGGLCSPDRLRRDEKVPEELKDICVSVGLDVRNDLLSNSLADLAGAATLEYAQTALRKAIPLIAQPDEVIKELLEHLRSALPEGMQCTDENAAVQRGTALLLSYLWRTFGEDGASLAQMVPLVSRGHSVVHWSPERTMMAPVSVWGQAAKQFSEAYPAERVLDDLYVDASGLIVPALATWRIANPDPITKSAPRELEGPRLAGMVEGDFDSKGVTIRGEEFSEIALLPREVINHVQDVDQARALLGLVLCHVAPNDLGWRERRIVQGTKAREPVDVPLRAALWLGDLRSRAWVPVKGEDEKPAKAAATASTLKPLLDPRWLDGNSDAISLLTECFGFDELDLRLLGIPDAAQVRVRQGLARLLESGGADPEFYESLAQEVEARQRRERDVERCRRMGFAVQEAVRQALVRHGLAVRLVDRGFDYEVSLPTGEALEDVAVRFEVGPYFVEVKATTSGPVRLTPLQADTAAGRATRYVLCVVDLRGVPEDRLDAEWTSADVEPLALMLSDIGQRVYETCVLVQRARESAVGIRNDTALRYEVPVHTWEAGNPVSDWVTTISIDPNITTASDN